MADQSILGGRELDAFLQSLPVKLERNILRSALRAGGNEFKAEAQANVPVKSGKLRKSVRVSTKSKGGKVSAHVKAGGKAAPHAQLVEFGTKPHKIAPKKAGGLTIGGNIVSAVDHPGAKPHPYMRVALDAKTGAAVQAVAQQVRKRLTKEGINVPAPQGE